MKLQGKKIALFVADFYEENEYWYPFYRMKEEGAEVVTIGPQALTYKSKNGIPTQADRSILEVKAEEFEALIIPGGYAPDHMRRVPEMVEFVRRIHELGKPVAAICHAGWMLASARIISDKKVTSYSSIRIDMENAGALWVDEEVVIDDGIITSRYPPDLPAFCLKIVEETA
jgi:protease I